MPGGRPTVFTNEVLQKLEQAFSAGCTDLEAALYANIAQSSLYNYQDSHPEFLERKEALKENVKLHAKLNLSHSIISEKNTDDSKWYLERKAKNEFNTKSTTELTGVDGAPIDHNVTVEYVGND